MNREHVKKIMRELCESVENEFDQVKGCTSNCQYGSHCFLDYNNETSVDLFIELIVKASRAE